MLTQMTWRSIEILLALAHNVDTGQPNIDVIILFHAGNKLLNMAATNQSLTSILGLIQNLLRMYTFMGDPNTFKSRA